MYDTKTRIALVKKRMHEYHRRQERRTVLYAQYTIVFFGDSIDDLKTVPLAEGKIKPYEDLFTPYFDYSCKNIDREVKFK